MTSAAGPRPLAHLRVVSVAEQYPGPYATMLLSDLGADVVQVERPAGDPTRSFTAFHTALSRGKRSVVLDLKKPADHGRFLDLIDTADVLIEGFRPGTMARLDLDYESLRDRYAQLIYVSISGFGQDGPYRDRPGHDLCYEAMAGLLYPLVGRPGPHHPPDIAVADLSAGVFACVGVLAALLDRDRTGRGHHVDVSMFDGLVSLLAAHLGPVANRSGPAGFPYEPGYGVFDTSDGAQLSIGVAHEDHFWRALCEVVGLHEDARLSSAERFAQADRLQTALRATFAAKPLDHWVTALEAADVPFAPMQSLADVLADPHVAARRLISSVAAGDPSQQHVRQPLVIDGQAYGPTRPAPRLGEHTAEVLATLPEPKLPKLPEPTRAGARDNGAGR